MRIVFFLYLICSCSLLFGQIYTWDSFTTENSPLPSNNLNALYMANDGILWIGSDSGLTGYNGSAWISYNSVESNLVADEIRSIQAHADKIWLGTRNGLSSGQISAIDDINWNSAYQADNSDLIHNTINAINLDSLGSYWICTDSGITVISDTSWLSFSAAEPLLSRNKILSINRQPTFMQYIGTESGGVSRMYRDVDGISGASTIWKQWTTFPDSTGRIRGLLSDTVTAILVDRKGDRWYGSNQGLSVHTGSFLRNPYSWKNYTMETGLIDNNIQTLAEDTTGAIWIGTISGVSKLIPEDTLWTNFTAEDGLVSNNVRDIAIAENGTIWLATNAGLSELNVSATSLHEDRQSQPKQFQLYPAYPNPFNMSTTIKFQIKTNQHIRITIFDVNGRIVNTILNSKVAAGNYKITWNGKNTTGNEMASGIYFARVSVSNYISTLKLVMIK